MTILSKMNLQTSSIPFRRMEDPHKVVMTMTEAVAREERFNGYTYEQAYVTGVRLQTRWYANQAQYAGRKEMAEKEILYFIYGPVIQRFNELRARSADRDWREVHRILDELQKELVG